MKRALISPDICKNCSTCNVLQSCPMNAPFRENDEDRPWIDFYRCSGCMKCKAFCAHKAVMELSHPCDGKRRMGW